jgi:hypothetical protein
MIPHEVDGPRAEKNERRCHRNNDGTDHDEAPFYFCPGLFPVLPGPAILTAVKLGERARSSCNAGHSRPNFFTWIWEQKKKRPHQAAWSLEVQFRTSWPAPGEGAGQRTVRCWGGR